MVIRLILLSLFLISCKEEPENSYVDFYKKNNSIFKVWDISSIRIKNEFKNNNCIELDLEIDLVANYNCYYEKEDLNIFEDLYYSYIKDKNIEVNSECLDSLEINKKLANYKKDISKLKGKNHCYKNSLGNCEYHQLDHINFSKFKNKKLKEFSEKYMYQKVIKDQVKEVSAEIIICEEEEAYLDSEIYSY